MIRTITMVTGYVCRRWRRNPAAGADEHALSRIGIQAPEHPTASAVGATAGPRPVQEDDVTALRGPDLGGGPSRRSVGPVPSFEPSPDGGVVGGEVPSDMRAEASPELRQLFQQGRGLASPGSSSSLSSQNDDTHPRARRAAGTEDQGAASRRAARLARNLSSLRNLLSGPSDVTARDIRRFPRVSALALSSAGRVRGCARRSCAAGVLDGRRR